jgi:hypothetical protein
MAYPLPRHESLARLLFRHPSTATGGNRTRDRVATRMYQHMSGRRDASRRSNDSPQPSLPFYATMELHGAIDSFDFGGFFGRFGSSSVGSVTPQRIAEQILHCPR